MVDHASPRPNNGAELTPTQTILSNESDGPRRLSFPQERLFLLDRIMPGLGAYNVPTLVRVPATLDEEQLRRAFALVVDRHEILRTRLDLVDGTPVQETFDAPPFELTVADLRSLPRDEAQARADDLLGELVGRAFSLAGDVLLRAALVHLAPDEDLLLVVFHHMGSDHLAAGLLFAELDEPYRALSDGREAQLPELPIQYADYAEWQRGQLDGKCLDELLDYWTTQLAARPTGSTSRATGPARACRAIAAPGRSSTSRAEVVAPLRELARGRGVSLFMVLTAAFKTLLHRYSGADRSRDRHACLRATPRGDGEPARLLLQHAGPAHRPVRRPDLRGAGEARPGNRVRRPRPSGAAVREARRGGQPGALAEPLAALPGPLRLRHRSTAPQQIAGHELERLPVPGGRWSRFDLDLILRDTPDGALHADVGYASDLFDAETIDRLLADFQAAARGGSRRPRAAHLQLAILSPQERRLTLEEWNDTAHDYDRAARARAVRRAGCAHARGDRDRRRRPNGSPTPSSTARANRLARELVAARRRTGEPRRRLLDRDRPTAGGDARRAQDRRRVRADRPDVSRPSARSSCSPTPAPVLLTQERVRWHGRLRGRARSICLDRDRCASRASAPSRSASTSTADDLAYVIYTSGSTGRPKGVEIDAPLGREPDRLHARAARH